MLFRSLDLELLGLADYCRFSAAGGIGPAEQARIIKANPDKTYIACGVSSYEDFVAAQKRGFTLFQGYYFSKKTITKKTKDIEPLKVNYFRLLQLTSTDGVKITKFISTKGEKNEKEYTS